MIKYNELLKASSNRAVAVLFRPFSLKKWLLLTLAMLISASYVCGCVVQFPSVTMPEQKRAGSSPQTEEAGGSRNASAWVKARQQVRAHALDGRVYAAVVFVLGLLAILQWLHARFIFVFLAGVARNDASLRAPFRESARMGDSYFLFSCALGLAVLAVSCAFGWWGYAFLRSQGLFMPGVHVPVGRVVAGILSRAALWGLCMGAAGIFAFLVRDLCTVIMFKQRSGVTAGLRGLWQLTRRYPSDVAVYTLVRGGLSAAGGFCSWVAACLVAIGMAVPLTSIAAVAAVAGAAAPQAYAVPVIVFAALAVAAGIALVVFMLSALQLPLAVFIRAVGAHFIARIEPAYDVMVPAEEGARSPGEARQSGHSPGLAGLLSFYLPGLGQVYNGEYAKGVVVFLFSFMVVPWVLGIVDAYKTGVARQRESGARGAQLGVLLGFACGMAAASGLILAAMLVAAVLGAGCWAAGSGGS